MDIAQYIADLLKEKDEVAVPSFGTFYTKKASAFFDPNSNSFIPPGRELKFKSDEGNPSLLVNYISQVKKLSKPSAKYFAEKFGETLKTEISLVGKADVLPLGVFEKISEVFVFTPSAEFKHLNYYGLESVEELQSKSSQTRTSITSDNDIIAEYAMGTRHASTDTQKREYHPAAETTATVHPIVKSDEEAKESPAEVYKSYPNTNPQERRPPLPPLREDELAENEPSRKNGWLVTFSILTVLAAAGLVGYLSYPEAIKGLLNRNTNKPVTNDITPVEQKATFSDSLANSDSLRLQDTVTASLQSTELEEKKLSDSLSNVTTKTDAIPQTDVVTYEIIGASLQTRKEADNYIRAMKAKGIDARIVENKPGRYIKVSIGSFSDPAKRDAELIRIKQNVNKNAWPLDVKNNRSEIKAN